MTGVRENSSLSSSICCCSLARYYTTHGYQDGRRCRNLMRETHRSVDTSERIPVKRWLKSFTCLDRNSASSKRFEPCYQQIYPSKKRKATFKIPKKIPYIPAVNQRKPTSYRNKYQEMISDVKFSRLQWPPLYATKKKDRLQAQQPDKTKELPPWLLPLYSCKTCPSKGTSSLSEDRYSGSAFHRKMEIAESIKHIRAKQQVILSQLSKKDARNDENTKHGAGKSSDAVETLKRRIVSMQSHLNAVKGLEAYRKRSQTANNPSELADNPVIIRHAHSRIHQTKSLPSEVGVRKSLGIDIVGPKAHEKPLTGTSNRVLDQAIENIEQSDRKASSTSRIQNNGEKKHKGELNISQHIVNNKNTPVVRNNHLSLGQFHKESVVLIKQPSWKKQQIMNRQIDDDTKTLNTTKDENARDMSTVNQQYNSSKPRQTKEEVDVGNAAANAWTVDSLKTRINVMKINKTIDETCPNKADELSRTRNGGEIRPKISQVALKSYHTEVGSKYPINAQLKEVVRSRPGYHKTVGRRNFSTSRHTTMGPIATDGIGNRRKIFSSSQAAKGKKVTWIKRIKKYFILNKTRVPGCLNWKTEPREIPYKNEEEECNSPAPILWKPPLLDGNLGKHGKSKQADLTSERVNPPTHLAERRVLAGISKIMTAKSPSVPGFRALDIEKKILRAEHKVNMMPWLKESKSHDIVQRSMPLKRCDKLELDKPQGTGYEWILKNRELVEDLKRQSRYAAGKSLVPVEVKNSIDQYKLPLKAEISKYRKKIDQKYADIFVYSTAKRWYSTCYAGEHRRILPCSDVFQVKKRGIKTTKHRNKIANPGKLINRKIRSDIRIDLRQYSRGVDNLGRRNDDLSVNPEDRSNKIAWNIPNKTRVFPGRLPLTSPNKSATTMSEMSPFVLKKQVEELKRLIKEAREDKDEKTEESPTESQPSESYETRLKRLIKAAHNNAQKMRIVEPQYTSENNLLANQPPKGKLANPRPMIQYDAKPRKCTSKPEVSLLRSLFKKTIDEPKSLADEIARRNGNTVLPGSNKEPKAITSRVYIKLKSLMEAVKKSSTVLDAKLLPTPNLKGSIMSSNVVTHGKFTEGSENTHNEVNPVTVELLAEKTQAPSNTVRLWKGESKPREFNEFKEKAPTYGDLMTLFSKAKDIFFYQLTELENARKGLHSTEITGEHACNQQSEKLGRSELSKNWLSIREDVSNAARAISEMKDDASERLESSHSVSSLLASRPKCKTDSLPAFVMNKPRMLPSELKSDSKIICDRMWSNIPISIQENGDLSGTTRSDNIGACESLIQHSASPSTAKIPITEAAKTHNAVNNEPSVILEPTNFLFQKPSTMWESISQKFGSSLGRNLLGKPEISQSNAEKETAFNGNQTTHPNPKTEYHPIGERQKSNDFETNQTHQHDTNKDCHSPENNSASHLSATPAGNVHELDSPQNATVPSTHDKDTEMITDSKKDLNFVTNLGPLEENVRTFENYYRRHFAEDMITRYEHLHLVYRELNKIHDLNQYKMVGSNGNQSREGNEANSHVNNPVINAALQKSPEGTTKSNISADEEIANPDFQRSVEMQKEEQPCPATNPGSRVNSNNLGGTEEVVPVKLEVHTSGIADSKINQEINVSSHGISNANAIGVIEYMTSNQSREQTSQNMAFKKCERVMKMNCDDDRRRAFNVSGETEAFEKTKSQVLVTPPDKTKNAEDNSTKSNNEFSDQREKTTDIDHLLMHDPTLKREVVEKLKLPVVMPDDRHAEKNWYTMLQSGYQHDQ